MVPIVAMVAGAAFRHEPLGANEFGAMACCCASLLVIVLQPRSRTADPGAPEIGR
jgi:drug/metabolite transporter (DMT)-like permease